MLIEVNKITGKDGDNKGKPGIFLELIKVEDVKYAREWFPGPAMERLTNGKMTLLHMENGKDILIAEDVKEFSKRVSSIPVIEVV